MRGVGLSLPSEKEQWYSNKDLYEMMVNLSKRLERTSAELEKTQVLIRDYNGLREKVDAHEKILFESQGKEKGGRDMWGYIVGGIGVLLAVVSFLS